MKSDWATSRDFNPISDKQVREGFTAIDSGKWLKGRGK
jgi:hypothetical protein